MNKLCFVAAVVATFWCCGASAQSITHPGAYKILDDKQYGYIAGEASGERALNTIYDLASYEIVNRNFDTLKESKYVYDKLKEYGLSEVKLSRYPRQNNAWVAVSGSLWMVSPQLTKLVDIEEMPAALAANSCDTTLEAPVVWVGEATKEELSAVDLKGKIAFGSVSVGQLYNACVLNAGALGVISCYAPRAELNPVQVINSSISAKNVKSGTFGFQLTFRAGNDLRAKLKYNKEVVVRVDIKTDHRSVEYQSPSAAILGINNSAEEVVLSAHLFEGYTKLGANDNMSGSAAILEVARTLNTLINNGTIPRPERTIRFIWGDEYVGIIPWVAKNRSTMERTLCNINLDMVGLALAKARSYYCLHRTSIGNAHYINDICQNYMRYVADTNTESIINGNYIDPIVAPSGTKDPFYYLIQSHIGMSDHDVFSNWGTGVPGVIMITWPDNNYHSSADRVEYLDATQLKRAVAIAAISAYTVASASEKMAISIANEVISNNLAIIAQESAKYSNYMAKSLELDAKVEYKKAVRAITSLYYGAEDALESVQELDKNSSVLKTYIEEGKKGFSLSKKAALDQLSALYVTNYGKPPQTQLSREEVIASKIYPKSTSKSLEDGYGAMSKLYSKAVNLGIKGIIYDANEMALLTKLGKYNLLQIKDILDYQTGQESSLEAIKATVDLMEKEGYVTIISQ